jgi:DNA polymerase-3 subunit delta
MTPPAPAAGGRKASAAADGDPFGQGPLVLIGGEDEFTVKQRARQLFARWQTEMPGAEQELIDASAPNSGEALKALARLREALQTLPFFGTAKIIWFQNCSFLGDDRTATTAAVTQDLVALADELKAFRWENVRLLISAGKVDRRKTFYRAVEKLGQTEVHTAWSIDDRDWAARGEQLAARLVRTAKKAIRTDALAELVSLVGPDARQLHNEVEKLLLFVGERPEIEVADVHAIVTRNKHARAFALADAVGERHLPRVLRTLDEELAELKTSSQRSGIGLLYGLIAKIRAMIFVKELLREGWLKPESDFQRFRARLDQVPAQCLSEEPRFNPLSLNPYVLFKVLPQVRNYTLDDLIRAMELLLRCNQRLVSSGLAESLVLQQTLVDIVAHRP